MIDLKTLALQSDPIQGEITEILSPELRAHVQTLIDAAVMKERARCDRLREALKDLLQWAIDVHDPRVQSKINYSGMDAARQALEEAR